MATISRDRFLVLATTSCVVAVHTATLLASISDGSVAWGLDYWRGLPLVALAVLYLLPAFTVAVGGVMHRHQGRRPHRTPSWTDEPATKRLAAITALILAGAAFWLARDATHLMGDGLLVIEKTAQRVEHSESAPLGGALMLRAADLVRRGGGVPSGPASDVAEVAVSLVSVICGVAFLALSWLVGGELWGQGTRRTLGTLLFLLHPTLVLFFGYAEFYPFAWVVALLTIWLALLCRRGRVPPWAVLAAWLIGVASHLFLLLYLPVVAWAFLPGPFRRRLVNVSIGCGAGLSVLALAGVTPSDLTAAFKQIGHHRHILGLAVRDPFTEPYGLFDIAHWVDVANEILLVMPLLALIPLWGWKRLGRDEALILAAVGTPTLVASFAIAPRLGYARDWDLMAFPALALNLLSAHLLMTLSRKGEWATGLRRMSLLLLGFGAARTVAWVELHHNPDRMLPRARAIAGEARLNAPFARRYLWGNLSTYYESRGNLPAAFGAIEEAAAIDWSSTSVTLRVAHLAHRVGEPESELRALERTVEIDSSLTVGWVELGRARLDRGDLTSADACFQRAIRAEPGNIKARLGIAIVESRLGNPERALAEAEALARSARDPDRREALRFLTEVLEKDGRAEIAAEVRKLAESPPHSE